MSSSILFCLFHRFFILIIYDNMFCRYFFASRFRFNLQSTHLSGDHPPTVVEFVPAVVGGDDVEQQDVLGLLVESRHPHFVGREHTSEMVEIIIIYVFESEDHSFKSFTSHSTISFFHAKQPANQSYYVHMLFPLLKLAGEPNAPNSKRAAKNHNLNHLLKGIITFTLKRRAI